MAASSGLDVKTPSRGSGEKKIAVIDRDVSPAWENEILPDFVHDWLLPMLLAGQPWPAKTSESGLSKLAVAYDCVAQGARAYVPPTGTAAKNIATGAPSQSVANFVDRAMELCGRQMGMGGVEAESRIQAQNANHFALDTQRSKHSINVAFWISVIAIAIGLLVAFFTAGSTTWLIGRYAQAARAAITRILTRLAAVAGRPSGAVALGRVTSLAGSTGTARILRMVRNPWFAEPWEEGLEELIPALYAEWKDSDGGWDWQRVGASALGGVGGGMAGMTLAGPVSRFTRVIPGLPGRVLNTGLVSAVSNPFGATAAGLAYGKLEFGVTSDQLMGGILGGMGRHGSQGPTSVPVMTAPFQGQTLLASAQDIADAHDLVRMGQAPGGPSGGHPPGGGDPSGAPASPTGGPESPGAAGGPAPVGGRTTGESASGPGGHGPTGGRSQGRHASDPDVVTSLPDENEEEQEEETGPIPSTPRTSGSPQQAAAQGGQQSQDPASQPDPEAAPQPDPGTAQAPESGADPTAARAAAPAPDPATGQNPAAPDPSAGQDPAAADPSTGQDPATPDPSTGQDPAAQQAQGAQGPEAQSGPAGPEATANAPAGAAVPATGATGETSSAQTAEVGTTTHAAAPSAAAVAPSPAITRQAATAASSAAIDQALFYVAPDALILQNGDVRLTDATNRTVVISAERVESATRGLAVNAKHGMSEEVLRAQAAAWLGSEIATASGGSKADGAIDALEQLSELHEASRTAAADTIAALISGNTDARLSELIAEDPGAGNAFMRPGFHDESAQNIAGKVAALDASTANTPMAPPVVPHTRPPRTSRTVSGALRTTATRPENAPRLSDSEIKPLVEEEVVKPSDLGRGVRSLVWSESGPQIRVELDGRPTLHIRLEYTSPGADLDSALTLNAGTESDPHVLRISPDLASELVPTLVPSVLVEHITHAVQDLVAGAQEPGRGPLRRLLHRLTRGDGGTNQAAYVEARFNEHRNLARRWIQASTQSEQESLQRQMEAVAADLRRRGETPPRPPSSVDDKQGVAPPAAPAQETPLGEVARQAQEQAISLQRAVGGLQARVDAHKELARKAKEERQKSLEAAEKARGERDQFAPERGRKARAEAIKHRETMRRHGRMVTAYTNALKKAEAAQEEYAALAQKLEQLVDADPVVFAAAKADLDAAAENARAAVASYKETLLKALPSTDILVNATAASKPQLITTLTERINAGLLAQGIDQQFTEDDLERTLLGQFTRLVSQEGVILRVGRLSTGEVRVKLSVTELVELINSSTTHSQTMIGRLPQGGMSVAAEYVRSAGVRLGGKLKALVSWLPAFGPGADGNYGQNRSVSGNAGNVVTGGAVEDIRGKDGSTEYEGVVTATAEIRTMEQRAWIPLDPVSDPADATMHLYIGTAHTDRPTGRNRDTTLAEVEATHPAPANPDPATAVQEKKKPEYPPSLTLEVTGGEALIDGALDQLGKKAAPDTFRQLRNFVSEVWPSETRTAVNSGLPGELTANGRPLARMELVTVPYYETAVKHGVATETRWKEDLGVGATTANGGQSLGYSAGGSVSIGGVPSFLTGALKYIGIRVTKSWAGSASVNYGRSRSESLNSGGTAFKPVVDRSMAHHVNLVLRHKTVLKITLIEDDKALEPIETEGELHIVATESEAARAGMPIESAAIVRVDGVPRRNSEGEIVLRDDPAGIAPREGTKALPVWQGTGTDQMADPGFALVKEVTNTEEALDRLIEQLRDLGFLPQKVNGEYVYSSDELEAVTQRINEEEMDRQREDLSVKVQLGQAMQQGLFIPLVRNHAWEGMQTFSLSVNVVLDHATARPVVEDPKQAIALLGIGSETNVVSAGRGHSAGGNLDIGGGRQPGENKAGFSLKAKVAAALGFGKNVGVSEGDTDNLVTLLELANLGTTQTEGVIEARLHGEKLGTNSEELGTNGERLGTNGQLLTSVPTTVTTALPTALLANEDRPPGEWQPVHNELASHATLVAVDPGPALPTALRLLDGFAKWGTAGLHHLANFFHMHSILGHGISRSPVTTSYAVSTGATTRRGWFKPRGPAHAQVSYQWDMTETRLVSMTEGVTGDILLQLNSRNVTSGASINGKLGAEASGGYSTATGEKGGFGVNHSRARSLSRSLYRLLIFGRERLSIDIGVQYVFQSRVKFGLSAFRPGDVTPLTDTVNGTALSTAPEEVALRLASQGKLHLPLWATADAIERWLDGNLTLDRTVAVPLVRRYLIELAATPTKQHPALADRHTEPTLVEQLQTLPGLEAMKNAPEGRKLSVAAELAAKRRPSWVARHLATMIGGSLIENTEFSRDGAKVDLYEEMVARVNELAPGAIDRNAGVSRKLYGSLFGRRWRGKVDDMTGLFGYRTTFVMRTSRFGGQRFRVRMRLTLDPDTINDLGVTKTKVPLDQAYTYIQRGITFAFGRTGGLSATGNGGTSAHGGGGTVSTDRNRSSSTTHNMQETSLERSGGPADMHRVEQQGRLEITVEREPRRFGHLRRRGRDGSEMAAPPFELDVDMVRLIDSSLIRPKDGSEVDRQTLPSKRDPRPFPMRGTLRPETVENDASVYRALSGAIAKRHGARAAALVDDQLVSMTSDMALLTLFRRMSAKGGFLLGEVNPRGVDGGPVASVMRRSVLGTDVTLEARTFRKGVVVGPLEGREGGEVHRGEDVVAVSVSTGQTHPVGRSASGTDERSTVSGGVSSGEQATHKVTVSRGGRDEHTRLVRGTLLEVEFEVVYDMRLTETWKRPFGRQVHGREEFLPEAGTTTMVVHMYVEELEAINAAIEAGTTLGSGWIFTMPSLNHEPITRIGKVDESAQWQLLIDARMEASKGRPVILQQEEVDGVVRVYLIDNDGVRSIATDVNDPEALLIAADHGFGEAFGSLPQALLDLATEHNLPLREMFYDPSVPGTLSDKVRARLETMGTPYTEPAPDFPAPAAAEAEPQPVMAGANVGQGSVNVAGETGLSAPSEAIPGTPFDPSARPAHAPLTLAELQQRIPTAEEMGDGFISVRLLADGRTLEVATEKQGIVYTQLTIGPVATGDNAKTDRDVNLDTPASTTINEDIDPVIVKATVGHEIVHLLQWAAAEQAGASQGVVRSSLPSSEQQEGRDYCLEARLMDHALLSGDWQREKNPAVQLRIAQAIEAAAADIVARGHLAPEAPWGSGPSVRGTPAPGSIADLLNSGAGPMVDSAAAIGAFETTQEALKALASAANVDSISPAGPGRFTVRWPGGEFSLVVSKAELPAGEVKAYPQLGRPSELVLEVSENGVGSVAVEVAVQIATQIADMAGAPSSQTAAQPAGSPATPLPSGRTMKRGAPDPSLEAASPVLTKEDLQVLARLRASIDQMADAPRMLRGRRETSFRAAVVEAGLEPGTPGSRTRLVAAARAGQLGPAHVNALTAFYGRQSNAAVAAAREAVIRAVERMGGVSVRVYGDSLLDIVVPGHGAIAVELPSHRGMRAKPFSPITQEGVALFQVAEFGSIGAIEREAAAATVGAVVRRLGMPVGDQPVLTGEPAERAAVLSLEDHQGMARLMEAVRQVETATPLQRPARARVLIALAESMGVAQGGPHRGRLSRSLANSLGRLVDRGPLSRRERLREWAERGHRLSNVTGWDPPLDEECVCPPNEKCVCGRRPPKKDDPSPTPSESPKPTPSATPQPEPSATPEPRRHVVGQGESLTKISRDVFGDSRYWREIWDRNRDVIGPDPNALEEGIELVMPDKVDAP